MYRLFTDYTVEDAKFPLGQLVITSGASEALTGSQLRPILARHQRGDWGAVGSEDARYNDQDLKSGNRLLSAYYAQPDDVKVWVITEWDRSLTTILLPSEY
jgi:hypothetical protein